MPSCFLVLFTAVVLIFSAIHSVSGDDANVQGRASSNISKGPFHGVKENVAQAVSNASASMGLKAPIKEKKKFMDHVKAPFKKVGSWIKKIFKRKSSSKPKITPLPLLLAPVAPVMFEPKSLTFAACNDEHCAEECQTTSVEEHECNTQKDYSFVAECTARVARITYYSKKNCDGTGRLVEEVLGKCNADVKGIGSGYVTCGPSNRGVDVSSESRQGAWLKKLMKGLQHKHRATSIKVGESGKKEGFLKKTTNFLRRLVGLKEKEPSRGKFSSSAGNKQNASGSASSIGRNAFVMSCKDENCNQNCSTRTVPQDTCLPYKTGSIIFSCSLPAAEIHFFEFADCQGPKSSQRFVADSCALGSRPGSVSISCSS